ncbi:MAG: tetratricopeptide repeat protein [Salinivirgaceae bacterium]|nr:tetratricopeptide repeat protein [Salinivirgaceae bacterium]MDD4746547.1 tetratricopeptide repeat protein [Salinivirgaceae bacterium]MDY0280001.1 tetratricopeptide repeat protein [Salinivirgaceae bacterium]
MEKHTTFKLTLTFGLIVIAFTLFGQQERKYIREGNELYRSAIDDSGKVDSTKMKEAAELYRKAIEKAPTSYQAKYNLANAKFKNQDYEAAEREFKSIQNSISHDTIQAKIYHNLGNSLLIQGKIEESIESYKNALRRNPKDIETKYNLALAQSKLDQMQNQQEQNQDQNQDENQDQDQKQEQSQDKKQEQQQSTEEKQAQEQQAEEKQAQADEENNDNISKEDALRILEALQNDEQNVQDKLKQQNKSKARPKSSRDW